MIYPNPDNPGDPGQAIRFVQRVLPAQVIVLPRGYFHYFINMGEGDFVIDLTFDEKDFDILSLNEITTLLPKDVTIVAVDSNPNNPILPFERP